MSELLARVTAIQPVVDRWLGKPFILGCADCGHLAADAMVAMGWPDPLEGWPAYSTPSEYRQALKAMGHASIAKAVEALGLQKIAGARAMPGDLLGYAGDGGGWGLGVAIGQQRMVAFAGGECRFGDLSIVKRGWRVECRKPR